MRSARAAAGDKALARESRALEHVAELEDMDDGAPQWVEVEAAASPSRARGSHRVSASRRRFEVLKRHDGATVNLSYAYYGIVAQQYRSLEGAHEAFLKQSSAVPVGSPKHN